MQIEQTEALGEPLEDPLLLFSVLYGFWAVNLGAFNGDVCRGLAAQFLALAEKHAATAPVMIGHRLMGVSLLLAGEVAASRAHLDQALALYNPAEHRPLAMRFAQDSRVLILNYRSLAFWLLGYPEAALAGINQALKEAREIGQAATLMIAITNAALTLLPCRNYSMLSAVSDELVLLAKEKGSLFYQVAGMVQRGCLFAVTGQPANAADLLSSGIAAIRQTGTTTYLPLVLTYLAYAYSQIGKSDKASLCVGEAMTMMERSKERWCEPEINRIAGEIVLGSPQPDAAKAEAYFDRALSVARLQQAKSWELRASMSLARLWRDQGKVSEARELLAPVYGWFTEGFDTRDLKEAKELLEQLSA